MPRRLPPRLSAFSPHLTKQSNEGERALTTAIQSPAIAKSVQFSPGTFSEDGEYSLHPQETEYRSS